MDEGGGAGIAVRSYKASRRQEHRAAAGGGCSEGITMTSRSWVVFPSLRGVLIGAQAVLIILMLGGAICLVVGGKALVDSQRFVAKATGTNGVVVDVAEVVQQMQKRRPGGDWYYQDVTVFHPVVRFVTAREQEVRFQASEGSDDPFAYRVGDSVRVLYDPASPQDARLDTWSSRWGDSIGLVIVGLVLVVIGTVGYWLLRSRTTRAARRGAQQNRRPQESEHRADGWPRRHVDHNGDQDSGDGARPAPAP
jgi:hypothetical protein